MKPHQAWIHFFNISEELAKSWEHESKCPLTSYWCLLHNKIDQSHFIAWAQSQYGLPYIQSDFFLKPIDKEFWNLIRQKAAWSEQFIPIGEWDGSVFVACAEPPQKDTWGFSVRYALTEAKTLHAYWKRLLEVRVGELAEVQSEFRNQGPLTVPKEIGEVIVTNLPLEPGEKLKEAPQVTNQDLELMRDEGESGVPSGLDVTNSGIAEFTEVSKTIELFAVKELSQRTNESSDRSPLDSFDATRSGTSDSPLDINDKTQAANSFPKPDSGSKEDSESNDLVLQNTGTFDFKFDSLLKKRKPFGS